jgi:soluble lytic murein transglycosylase-like protein
MMTISIASVLLAAELTFGLPKGLLSAVCFVESGHRPHVVHRDDGSGQDSIGLCQIQPRTARDMGFVGPISALDSPKINSRYAAAYLHYQLVRYNGDVTKAVSAYNLGTYRKNKHGDPVNHKYVDRVKAAWRDHK